MNNKNMKHDPVNHPIHYCSHPSGTEAIVLTENIGFNLGNALKYLYRCGHKGYPVQDLSKALWYLNRELQRREAHPRWRRLWSENGHYDAMFDGPSEFQWMISFESRYSGHMSAAMCDIMAAAHLRRGVRGLRSAISHVERMIRVQEWRESEVKPDAQPCAKREVKP